MSVYSFRITTNGVLRNYRSNLNQSYKKLNSASERVMTGRKFNSYAEDPSAASRAFQLRRSMWRAEDQLTSTNNTYSKFQTAYSALGFICDGDTENPGLTGLTASLAALNDPTGDARSALAEDLEGEAESVLQLLNTTYGGNYVFAGADGKNVPFTWKLDDDGNKVGVLYRGIDLDTTDPNELDKLKKLAGETTYIDVGLGLEEDADGNAITTSVYNSALSGLNFIGYGLDEDNEPKNVISLMLKMADVCRNYNTDDAAKTFGKLQTAVNGVAEARVKLSAGSKYLLTNATLLGNTSDNLNEQRAALEDIDEADAITQMSYASYCYNAALKIGNSILSQSLLDYMS